MKTYLIGERLAVFDKRPDANYWASHWKQQLNLETIRASSDRFLLRKIRKAIPQGSWILEGGCGIGYYVLALSEMGYKVIGVDYAEDTLRFLKENFSTNFWVKCDVRQLALPNECVDGYLSLGVLEHFREGPESILVEINRVLKPGGILFVTVPTRNIIRNFKAKFGFYPVLERDPESLEFYQYFMDRNEMKSLLNEHGFEVLNISWINGFKVLKDEVGFLKRVLTKIGSSRDFFSTWVRRGIQVLSKPFFGHMSFFLCKKVNGKIQRDKW
jgi:SAM-dependent methyltransferase